MRKILFLMFTTLALSLNAAAQNNSAAIDWRKDFQEALALSRETGKPLLLDFTAVWCQPCREMEKTFWVRGDVIERMKSFIAVKIDYDKEKSLVNRFSVSGLPYIAFSDPLGNVIGFRKGLSDKNADDLSAAAKRMPKDFSPLKKAYAAVETNKNDGIALLQIADFYRDGGLLKLSNGFYERADRTFEINKSEINRERIAATVGLNYYEIRDYRPANEKLEKYLQMFPAGKSRDASIAALADGNAKLGNISEAEKYLEMLKSEFPASKNLPAANKAVAEAKVRK